MAHGSKCGVVVVVYCNPLIPKGLATPRPSPQAPLKHPWIALETDFRGLITVQCSIVCGVRPYRTMAAIKELYLVRVPLRQDSKH